MTFYVMLVSCEIYSISKRRTVKRKVIWRTYSHHSTRAGASDEDLAGIAVVLLEGVGDHVSNGIAVTTTIVLQGLLRRDIPASPALVLLSAFLYIYQILYNLRGEKKDR